MTSDLISRIDPKKLEVWDIYLQSLPAYWDIYKKYKKSAKDLLIFAAKNLIHSESDEEFNVYINDTIYSPFLDTIKLNSFCKLINFGDLTCKGYPIFTECFDYIAENIQDLVDTYLLTH